MGKIKTTKSSRKHAFSSFREKIDSIKIEPSLKLVKRSHDYVETSHFLACFEHWKEINISGKFTEFAEEVESLCQTLPQILFHQSKIFDKLQEYINYSDSNSLQPLLEILAQFVHDLGSDFMPYYEKSLQLIIKLTLNTDGNSDILEWAFSCLAFIFKYLTRTLSHDLIPTFKALLPLLSLKKKEYISRFCSEALSFLIRKTNPINLNNIIIESFNNQKDLISNNQAYCNSLIIIFSESMKNTRGTFHSRSLNILQNLFDNSFIVDPFPKFISILSDVILRILNHGSTEACKEYYESITTKLDEIIVLKGGSIQSLISINQIITTISFAESGQKVTDWSLITSTLTNLIEKAKLLQSHATIYHSLIDSILYTFSILLRNCEMKELTKYHVVIFKSAMDLNNGSSFLPFIESSISVTRDKTVSFGGKFIQEFIAKKWNVENFNVKISLFLTHMLERSLISKKVEYGRIQITIVHEFYQNLLENINTFEIKESNDLPKIYWQLLVMRHTKGINDSKGLMSLLYQLTDPEFKFKCKFSEDLIGAVMNSLAVQGLDDDISMEILKNILTNFTRFQQSSLYVLSVSNFIKSLKDKSNSVLHLKANMNDFALLVTENLSLPHHDSRNNALELLVSLLEVSGIEIPNIILSARLIEQIPLTLEHGRDISSRIRNLAIEFASATPEPLLVNVVSRYLFGLLTVKFSPSWEAVYAALPTISVKIAPQIWELSYNLIKKNYNSQEDEPYFVEDNLENSIIREDISNWLVSDSRLQDSFYICDTYYAKYFDIDNSIIEYAQTKRAGNRYSDMMRSQVIKALLTVPSIGERNSRFLVPLLLNEDLEDVSEEDEDIVSSSSWTVKDRNSLIQLFTKFNKMTKLYKAEEVYDYMLNLLCNKSTLVQKLALDCLINWKNPHVNKYKDNLRNLLDDTVFRDEIAKFITKDETNTIEDEDVEYLMPLVLRILFGRAQSPKSGGNKQGRKFAVITVLPNLTDENIITFLELGSCRIGYQGFFDRTSQTVDVGIISERLLRRMNGYINLLLETYNTLGLKYNNVLETTVEPLLYALCVAQAAIDNKVALDNNVNLDKAARNVRQSGMKALAELFELLANKFSWSPSTNVIYGNIMKPRFVKFKDENLQQPSSLMKMIANWINFKSHHELLFVDDYAPVKAMLSLLGHEHAKDSVIGVVLDFALAAVKANSSDEKFFYLIALVVDAALKTLPDIFIRVTNKEINSKAINLLLSLVENQYIDDNETRRSLINALSEALDRPNNHVDIKDKANILTSLAALVENFDCSFEEVSSLYKVCSKSFKNFSDKVIRTNLVSVFKSFGSRFTEFEEVAVLLEKLNAFTRKNMGEPDFEQRLDAYKTINEVKYKEFSTTQWLPIIYCALYFINDELELSFRTNSMYTICRFVDCFSSKSSSEEADPYIRLFKDVILPNLRLGIRSKVEVVQTEYIAIIAHIVEKSNHYTDLNDMKVLLFKGDDEANFFLNINHIQIHRRQRAVRRLREVASNFSDNSISHYIIPIIEHYAFCSDEKLRNVANDTIETIGELVTSMNWNQFKALFRRYISNLTMKKDHLKDSVSLVITVSKAFYRAVESQRNDPESKLINNLPHTTEEIHAYITNEISPPIMKVLAIRDDETVVSRVPLSEALTSLVMCLPEDSITTELPAVLTNVCQVMKSRSEELRDIVRKSLGRIAKILGSKYIKFILKELKGALRRGSQIHVLSFTIHALLVSMADVFQHGDLNECAEIIVEVIMEDTFGAAGQEKDADGYHSKMKEVKFHKSFDTAEILASNITLSAFTFLITPIKYLLKERMALKTQNKLEELLRRYALGLNHNSESSSRDILVLCYELHKQSLEILGIDKEEKKKDEATDHFLVKLSARPLKTQMEFSIYVFTLQKFAFELLKTAISRHESLLTVSNLEGFVPLLEHSLSSDNEGVLVSALKVLTLLIKLPFSESIEAIFKSCARRALNIIKDCPSTNSELCQGCLKYLSTIIRHKSEIKLKDTAISYVLVRIQPDLEEPHRQGTAFNFLKSVVSQHIMVPEVYDIMDKVSTIMITNHTKEIRDMSRSVYFQFLMEYDQGRGRLEKQFKFLVDNLEYPAQAGRQSVMELIHLILVKSGPELLQKLATSFFVALASTIVSDDSTKCREMAVALISTLFKKLNGNLGVIDQYCSAWLSQNNNNMLSRCGLHVYKIFVTEVGFDQNPNLDKLALERVRSILKAAKNSEEDKEEIEWESVYSALTVFSAISAKSERLIFGNDFKETWSDIVDCLLYPHSWVRLASCRIVSILLTKIDKLEFKFTDYEIQTIAYRLLRQLGAPSISEALGTQVVSNLTLITMRWEKENTSYVVRTADGEKKEEDEATESKFATDWIAERISAIMRNEVNAKDAFASKKSSIQFTAMLIQLLSVERLGSITEKILLSLYNINELESVNDEETELKELASECSTMLQSKLGISEYTQFYSKVQRTVNLRRQDRRAKRAQLAVTAPESAARRKLKKHERSREKRKHDKDDNGYYHSKKRVDRK